MDRHYIKKHPEGTKAAIVLLLLIVLAFQPGQTVRGQVTVGNNAKPAPRSLLEISTANTKGGLRLPQLTTKQRDDLTKTQDFADEKTGAAVGLMIMNMDTRCVEYWSGSQWIARCGFDLPSIEAELVSAGPFCPDEDIQFRYTLGGVNGAGMLYVYEGGDGSVGSGTQLDLIPDLQDGQDVWRLPAEADIAGLRNPGGTYTIWFEVMHEYTGARIRAAAVQYTIKAAAEFTSPASNTTPYNLCSHASNTQTLSVTVTDPDNAGITSYKWYVGAATDTDPGEGTLLATHPKTTVTDTYDAPLTDNGATKIYWCDVTNSCGTVTRCPYPFTITTYATPGIPDTPADATVCPGDLFTLNVTGLSGGKTPYSLEVWDTGGVRRGTQGGITGTSANVDVTPSKYFNTATTYYVKVIDDCGHSSQSQEFTLTTTSEISVDFSYGPAATTTCTQTVTATASGGRPPYTYRWYWNTTGVSGSGTYEAPASPGKGNATGTVSSHGTAGQTTYWFVQAVDSCSWNANSTAKAMTLGTPTVTASGGNTTARCSANLTVSAKDAALPYSVQWYRNGSAVAAGTAFATATASATPIGTEGSIATQGGSHTLNNVPSPASGSYYYFAVVTSACGVRYVSASQQVSAGSALAISVTGDGATVCKNTTQTVSYSLSGGVTNYKSVVLQKNANNGNANGAWSTIATQNNPSATNTIGLTTENTDNITKYYKLILTDQCDHTIEQTFTLKTPVAVTKPSTNATSYTACPGTSLEITATNIGGGKSPYTVTVYNSTGTAITSATNVTASSRAISFTHGVAAGASANFTVGVKDACNTDVRSNNFTVTVPAALGISAGTTPGSPVGPGSAQIVTPNVTGGRYPITLTVVRTTGTEATVATKVLNAASDSKAMAITIPDEWDTTIGFRVSGTDACGATKSYTFSLTTIPHIIVERQARDWFANGSGLTSVNCEVSAKYHYTLTTGTSILAVDWYDNPGCTGTPLKHSNNDSDLKYDAPCLNATGYATRELWCKLTARNLTYGCIENILIKVTAFYRCWSDGRLFVQATQTGQTVRMGRTYGKNDNEEIASLPNSLWTDADRYGNADDLRPLILCSGQMLASDNSVVTIGEESRGGSEHPGYGSVFSISNNAEGRVLCGTIGFGCTNAPNGTLLAWQGSPSYKLRYAWTNYYFSALQVTLAGILRNRLVSNANPKIGFWDKIPYETEKLYWNVPPIDHHAYPACSNLDDRPARGYVESFDQTISTINIISTDYLTRLGEP